ncbi:LysR family transcriptional regulator [Colwellia psychrerythraea]|uniref:Substrate-binding transcriptional regulator, LysR family n=1 Tax=Colwellia psychrerythraea (strain 34H / ATCC BAA-681) TaxID=167879 RepID=Q47W14_COLP3|nr:LysR family transcriptional regulator [Colwellia psychrerythraea]AAZ26637.1 substrate-binding transcriptional regulator, LysR family [Colwellia psychrerythraea 34H]
MFEIKHLKTLTTLANTGNIRKAAEVLFSSQSALSHQIKDLEQRLNAPLFIRNTSPVEFTEAGKVLLSLGEELLPKIKEANITLKSPSLALSSLKIAIACHACFQWLLPVTSHFSQQKNNVELEFIDESFEINKHKNQSEEKADILFTDEKLAEENVIYQEIGQFEVMAVLSNQQASKLKLSERVGSFSQGGVTTTPYLLPENFSQLTLLTYPLPPEQLDIFKLFLTPAKCKPSKIKQVTNSHVMLQMVSANMGVATLPDWLVSSVTKQSLFRCMRLGETGIHKKLYARYDKNSKQIDMIEKLLPEAIREFTNLYIND